MDLDMIIKSLSRQALKIIRLKHSLLAYKFTYSHTPFNSSKTYFLVLLIVQDMRRPNGQTHILSKTQFVEYIHCV